MLWYGYLTFLGRVLRHRGRANPVLRSDLLLTFGISGILHLISISSSSIACSIALNLAFATATFLFAARIAKSFLYSVRSCWCLCFLCKLQTCLARIGFVILAMLL